MILFKNKMHRNLTLTFFLAVVILAKAGVSCAAILKDDDDSNVASDKSERTLILLKPDAVKRGLIGRIIQRFESKGFRLVAMKLITPTRGMIEDHYRELKNREFYTRMLRHMCSGPVIPMVWEGLEAVQIGRRMMGASGPLDSPPGTIRGDFSIDVQRNVIHGSHSVEAAKYEINVWFNESEMNSWTPGNIGSLYE